MRASAFWKAVTVDHANLLDRVLALLREHGIRYCVVGGQAANAYVEPLVSLDIDADIARILEAYPRLRDEVPADVLERLM